VGGVPAVGVLQREVDVEAGQGGDHDEGRGDRPRRSVREDPPGRRGGCGRRLRSGAGPRPR
jgi:hypothetical protein